MSVVVSVRISKKLKEEAERLGIKMSEFLKKALENEVERHRLEELSRKLNEVSVVLEKIDIERFVRHVREDRDTR